MNKDTKYNAIDLFCGAGGLSYGFELAGFNILLGIDNDSMALKTFTNNHKNAKSFCGDITKVSSKDIYRLVGQKPIDVIIGGPPCQGFSLSGPRNFNDPRNSLYLSYIRLVKEIRPKIFLIENVPGIIKLFGGVVKNNIIKAFTDCGYTVQYKVLCASDFGVPQMRKRVFFVGTRKGFSFSYPKTNNVMITCGMALSDLPPLPDNSDLGLKKQDYYLKPQNYYQKEMRSNSKFVYNHITAHHSERVKKIISLVPPGGNYKDLPLSLRETAHFHVAWTRFPENKPAPTIDTGHRHHFHYKYNRVPTVRECARIQSFPDCFVFEGTKTQQFRQVGNAVPPLLAKAVAIEIKKSLEDNKNV